MFNDRKHMGSGSYKFRYTVPNKPWYSEYKHLLVLIVAISIMLIALIAYCPY